MNGPTFRKGIEDVLIRSGFARVEKALARRTDDVWTLVDIEHVVDRRWTIDAGFSLCAIEPRPPMRVNQTHLYFRLERLFPEHHEIIVVAGLLDDPGQPTAYAALIQFLSAEGGAGLLALGTEAGLRKAMTEGRLAQGLVRAEARELLSRSAMGSIVIPITAELRDIASRIVRRAWSVERWSANEGGDTFQGEHYSGGFEAIEQGFCFSYFAPNGDEYWFTVSLDEVEHLARGEDVRILGRPAE